jgi:hypothetical protein
MISLRGELFNVYAQQQELNEHMRPHRIELWRIKNQIIHTFPHDEVIDEEYDKRRLVVLYYTRAGAEARFGLFAQQDHMNAIIAPMRKRERELKAYADYLKRMLKHER